jgi:23S rRNA pseudouridine2604 synthase
MRVKLTAKHPRPDSPNRRSVRPDAPRDVARRQAARHAEGTDAAPDASAPHARKRGGEPAGARPRKTAGDRASKPAAARNDGRTGGRDRKPGTQRDSTQARGDTRPLARGEDRPVNRRDAGSVERRDRRDAPPTDRVRRGESTDARMAKAPVRRDRRPADAYGHATAGQRNDYARRGRSDVEHGLTRGPARGEKPGSIDRKARQSPAQTLAERIGAHRPTTGGRLARAQTAMTATTDRPRADSRGPRGRPATERGPAARRPGAPRAVRGEAQPSHADAPGLMRLSKRMSELGLCSRREADEWIEKGWVRVDGQIVNILGAKVTAEQHIDVLPHARAAQARQVTIVLNKPVGYVCAQPEDDYPPAVVLVTPANRWSEDDAPVRFSAAHLRSLAPAGRLDIDSTGLLILTQDGRIAKQLIGEHSEVEKEYLVRVRFGTHDTDVERHFPHERLAQLRHGLSLDGVQLKPAGVDWQNGEQLRFILREGRKRQIRRMCELVGLEVVGLKRVRVGNVMLGALPPGKWRYLRADECF